MCWMQRSVMVKGGTFGAIAPDFEKLTLPKFCYVNFKTYLTFLNYSFLIYNKMGLIPPTLISM